MSVCMCMCGDNVFMHLYVSTGTRGGQMLKKVSFIAFCLVFCRPSFSLSLKLLDSTMIAGSQVLGILLPRFCPRAGVIDTCHYVWLFMWVLRHKLRSLFLYSWHLWPSHLPSLLIALFSPKILSHILSWDCFYVKFVFLSFLQWFKTAFPISSSS